MQTILLDYVCTPVLTIMAIMVHLVTIQPTLVFRGVLMEPMGIPKPATDIV